MAKTIYQRIALEGGDEIAAQLRAIGKDGEAAFVEISAAAGKLKKDLAGVGSAFGNFAGSLATVGKRAGIAAVGIVAAGAGLVAFAKIGTDAADAASKQAQAAGLAIDEYGRLAFAAEQSGVSQGELGAAMTRLNKELGDVAGGSEKAAEKFAALGVSVTDSAGNLRPTESIMQDLSDAFSKMPDGAEKSAAAIDLFGRSGANLLPLLNSGSAGLLDLGKQAERLGIVFSAEQGRIAEGMNDALSALNKARQGVQSQLGLLFAPTITKAAQGFTDLITRNRVAIEEWTKGALAKAVPLVEDLINAIIGNDADVKNIWVIEARDRFIEFASAVKAAVEGIIIPAFNLIVGAADKVAAAINGIFGTEFSGQSVLIAAALAKFLGIFGLLASSVGLAVASFKALGSAFGLVGAVVANMPALFGALATALSGVGTALVAIIGLPALIVAGIVAAGVAIFVFWDEIKAGAAAVFDFVAGVFEGLPAAIGGFISSAADATANAWDNIAELGSAAFRAVRNSAVNEGGLIRKIWEGHIQLFDLLWSRLRDGAAAAWGWITEGFQNALNFVGNLIDNVVNRIARAFEKIKSIAKSVQSQAASIASNNTGSSSQRDGFASGGYVRGPGSGTSDSIMARLSNGEFVIKAAAVRHYGPQLLAALNNMRLPKAPGFAAGGLVEGLTSAMQFGMPRFAAGGPVLAPASSGRPITLTIDGQSFDGLSATDKTADDLMRFATGRRLRSAGRKPGWVGA